MHEDFTCSSGPLLFVKVKIFPKRRPIKSKVNCPLSNRCGWGRGSCVMMSSEQSLSMSGGRSLCGGAEGGFYMIWGTRIFFVQLSPTERPISYKYSPLAVNERPHCTC